MTYSFKSNKQLVISIISIFFILFGLSLCITPIDNIVIHYVEIFFHKKLRDPGRWIDVLQNTSRIGIFIIVLFYFLTYINLGLSLKAKIFERISEIKQQFFSNKSIIITFSLLTFFFCIAFYGVISSNYFFADDIFRNYGGNRSWIGFSRYISEFGSILIHNNLKLNDIAPFTQFLSILICSLTVIFLAISFTESVKYKYLLALSLIFITPFFCENISYRYDCPYMAMSLLFASLPFLFKRDNIVYCFVSVLSLLLTCFSYQAALTLYILSAIFIFSINLINGKDLKENFLFAMYSVIAFIITLVIFKIFFMNKMSNTDDDYFSTVIKLTAFVPNTIRYLKTTFILNGGHLLKLLFVINFILPVIFVFATSKSKKIISALFCLLILIASYILSFGPYLVFERPVFASRAFMGFNVFFALILLSNIILAEQLSDKSITTTSILLYMTVYACIIFMFTYGNSLKNQKEYEAFRTQLVLSDLSEITDKQQKYNITIEGDIGQCQKNKIAYKNYPLIKSLISPRPSDGHIWNEQIFNVYNFNCTSEREELTDAFVLVKQTYYHDIYQKDNSFIIRLKK